MPSMTTVARPSDAPYTEAAKPAGPAPTTATSKVFCGSTPMPNPAARASWPFDGLHKTSPPRMSTTGASLGLSPWCASTVPAAGSVSRSTQTWGRLLRAAKSRSRRASGDDREPTICLPVRCCSSHCLRRRQAIKCAATMTPGARQRRWASAPVEMADVGQQVAPIANDPSLRTSACSSQATTTCPR
jgi:hypothetical protein